MTKNLRLPLFLIALSLMASIFSGPAAASRFLSYEFDPGPMQHSRTFNIFALNEPDIDCEVYGSCGTFHLNPISWPKVELNTAYMPFDLREKTLFVSNYSANTGDGYFEGIRVTDKDDNAVFERETDYDFIGPANPWLVSLPTFYSYSRVEMSFDENLYVSDAFIDLVYDPTWGEFGLTNSSYVDFTAGACARICIVTEYEGTEGQWLVNGMPQPDPSPAAVPLPAAGLLYAPILLVAGGTVIARRRDPA